MFLVVFSSLSLQGVFLASWIATVPPLGAAVYFVTVHKSRPEENGRVVDFSVIGRAFETVLCVLLVVLCSIDRT